MNDFKENPSDIIETQQVMTLADETVGENFERIMEKPILSGEERENRTHGITDFLTRFTKIQTVTLSEGMEQNHVVAKHGFPSTLLKLENYAEKCQGFKYLRGGIVVRVQSNLQMMQQMALQCMMMPVESPNDVFDSQVNTSIKNASQTPGGVYLVSKDNVFEYTQPFVYPTTAYDMTISSPDYVTMIIKVLSPLRGNGEDVTLTIFARFADDVQVSMPTSDLLYYTPTILINQLKRCDMSVEDAEKIEGVMRNARIRRLIRNEGTVDEERAVSAGGPVSNVLSAVGNLGSTLAATGIPVLDTIGTVGSVIGNVGSKIASIFGFSEPDNNTVQTLTFPSISKGMNNSNYPHTHHQMALSVENKLAVDRQIYGTPVDEMALQAIVRTPTLIRTHNLSNTDVSGSRMFWVPVTPVDVDSGTDWRDVSALTFGALSFAYWRGSINYVLVPVKTKFHSARIIAVWFNSSKLPPATYDETMSKNFSVMIDLSDERMEYGFSVPYIQALQWLTVSDSNYKAVNGYIGFYLINKLVNASNTSPSIDLLLYHYAGNDFQVAVPQTPSIWVNDKLETLIPKSIKYGYWTLTTPDSKPAPGQVHFKWKSPQGVESDAVYPVQEHVVDKPASEYTWYTVTPPVIVYNAEPIVVTSILFGVNTNAGPGENGVILAFNGDFPWWSNYQYRTDQKIFLAARAAINDLYGVENQINRTDCIAGLEQRSIASGETISLPAANVTIGEEIASIRTLIKRAHPIVDFKRVWIGEKHWIVVDALLPVTHTSSISVPYKDFFSPGFRFQSGSMRYILSALNMVGNKSLLVYFLPGQSVLRADPSTLNSSQVIYCPVIEGICKIEVPYYNRNVMAIIGDLETRGGR